MNTEKTKIGAKQVAIILLTLATAGIHLTLITKLPGDMLFALNALGYLSLLLAYFLPVALLRKYHGIIRWVFIGFTVVTILAWVAIGMRSMEGYITKLIEVVLVILLLTDRQPKAG